MAIKTSEVNTSALFAESMLVVTTLLWGSTFVVIKTGLNDASPLLFLCLRFALALAIGCFLWRKKLRTINRATLLHGLLLGFFMFGGYGSQTYGLAFTTVAKSGLFTYVYALITPALQYLLVRKPLRMGNLIGLLIVVSGMLLFTHPSAGTLNVGDWVTLGGAGLFAFYVVLLDRYTSTEEPVQLLLVQFFTTSLLAGAASLLIEPHRYVAWSGGLFFSLGYLAVVGSVVAVYIMNRYQKETTPTKAVLIYALEPVFTVIFGYLVLREGLDGTQIGGGALILCGVVFSELWGLRRRKA